MLNSQSMLMEVGSTSRPRDVGKMDGDTREGIHVYVKGYTDVVVLVKEVSELKQVVECMKETVAGLRLKDKGAETGSRVTMTGVN